MADKQMTREEMLQEQFKNLQNPEACYVNEVAMPGCAVKHVNQDEVEKK